MRHFCKFVVHTVVVVATLWAVQCNAGSTEAATAETEVVRIEASNELLGVLQKWDPNLWFFTSRQKPLRMLDGLTQDEIACWGGSLFKNVLQFREAIGIPTDQGNLGVHVISVGHNRNFDDLKTYGRDNPVRLFITWSDVSPNLIGALRVVFVEAVPRNEQSSDQRKERAEMILARAEILSLLGNDEEAYEAFEEVLNLAVDAETKARASVGMACVLDGDCRTQEAQELYLQASELTKNPNTKAMILIGQSGPLLQQRRLAEARTKVEEALGLATEPQTKATAMMTAAGLDVLEGHVEQGRRRFVATGEIVESAIRAAQDNEKKAHLKLVLATIYMAQSRWNDVETTIKEAFDLTENAETKSTILQFQGGIFSLRKQIEKARHTFEHALELAPTPDHLAKCFTGLGEVAEYEGKPSEALANYDKALAQATSKETRSLALFKRGTVLMEQGRSEEAVPCFEEVIRLTHSIHRKARSLANIGSTLARQGKLTEARAKLEEALSFPLRPSVKKQIENLLQEVKRATGSVSDKETPKDEHVTPPGEVVIHLSAGQTKNLSLPAGHRVVFRLPAGRHHLTLSTDSTDQIRLKLTASVFGIDRDNPLKLVVEFGDSGKLQEARIIQGHIDVTEKADGPTDELAFSNRSDAKTPEFVVSVSPAQGRDK